jgi:hypothetical protein
VFIDPEVQHNLFSYTGQMLRHCRSFWTLASYNLASVRILDMLALVVGLVVVNMDPVPLILARELFNTL